MSISPSIEHNSSAASKSHKCHLAVFHNPGMPKEEHLPLLPFTQTAGSDLSGASFGAVIHSIDSAHYCFFFRHFLMNVELNIHPHQIYSDTKPMLDPAEPTPWHRTGPNCWRNSAGSRGGCVNSKKKKKKNSTRISTSATTTAALMGLIGRESPSLFKGWSERGRESKDRMRITAHVPKRTTNMPLEVLAPSCRRLSRPDSDRVVTVVPHLNFTFVSVWSGMMGRHHTLDVLFGVDLWRRSISLRSFRQRLR